MKRKFLKQAMAVLLSASMMLECGMPVLADEASVSGNDAEIAAEDASADEAGFYDLVVEDDTLSGEVSGASTETPKPKKLSAPAAPSAKIKDEKTIQLSWGKVSGAKGYEVYSSTNGAAYVLLWSLNGDGTTGMDVLATADKHPINIASEYKFKVKAISKDGAAYDSDLSGEASAAPSRNAQDWLLAATPQDYQSVTLSWKPANGVSGYQILMSNSENGPYTEAAKANAPGATITGLSMAKNYFFKVKAFVTINGNTKWSTESAVVNAKPALAAPVFKSVVTKTSTSNVTIKWKKVPGATGYEVLRSKSKSKKGTIIAGGKKKTKYNKIKKLKKLSFVDKNAAPGVTYWYKVRAYKTIGKKRYYSEIATWQYATAVVTPTPKFIADSCGCVKPNKVTLNWKKVKKAKGYIIQRSLKKTKGFETVATVEDGNTTIVDIDQPNGKTVYYYRIQAYTNKNKKKTYSYKSEPIALISNYFTYPEENYQARCQRVFGQNSYKSYNTQAEADGQMAEVGYIQWSVDAKKPAAGYTKSVSQKFRVNKKLQPTVAQIVTEIQSANIKIVSANGYNYTPKSYLEEKEGVVVRIEAANGTPGSNEYNAITNVMAKYGFNRVSSYSQSYDPYSYVYVGRH